MGWLFTEGQTKADLIQHLTEGDSGVRTHRKCVRGSTLWTIQENLNYPEFGRFIVAYQLRSDPGFGWDYKPVTESMGPSDTSCPLSYLDDVPAPDSEFAGPWRDHVRQRHADRRKRSRMASKASIGDQLLLTEGARPRSLTVVSIKPLIGEADDGSWWRVPPGLIDTIQPVG